jgi:hypothetical protein
MGLDPWGWGIQGRWLFAQEVAGDDRELRAHVVQCLYNEGLLSRGVEVRARLGEACVPLCVCVSTVFLC